MTYKPNGLFDKVLRNKAGAIVVWQNPNIPLWGWIACSVLGFVFKHGITHSGLRHLGEASLFAWAYLEIRSGESLFRRILGGLVMASIVFGFFSLRSL
jgi:hypothetical protein